MQLCAYAYIHIYWPDLCNILHIYTCNVLSIVIERKRILCHAHTQAQLQARQLHVYSLEVHSQVNRLQTIQGRTVHATLYKRMSCSQGQIRVRVRVYVQVTLLIPLCNPSCQLTLKVVLPNMLHWLVQKIT